MISRVTTQAIEVRTLTEQETAVAYATLPIAEIGPWLEKAFREVAVYLERKGAGPTGLAFARYRRSGDGLFEVEAGFPASTPTSGEGNVEPSDLPGGPAAVTVHVGPSDAGESAAHVLQAWVREQGAEPVGEAWEVFFIDATIDHDLATWRTEVIQPFRPRASAGTR
jgi:effector-binding domain-containing protein